jgi:hypothetical protein
MSDEAPVPVADPEVLKARLAELTARRDHLLAEVRQAQQGDEETLALYDTPPGRKRILLREEVRRRINRSACVTYWSEIRATEKLMIEIAGLLASTIHGDCHVFIHFDGPQEHDPD